MIEEDAYFMIRILLLHDYRRLLFKDPQLPVELLPSHWSGTAARELVKEIYKQSYKKANSYYLKICSDDELKPRLKRSFTNRFGELK